MARRRHRLAVDLELEIGLLGPLGAGDHLERDEADPVVAAHHGIVDQSGDVLVEDLLLLVGQLLEAAEGILQRIVAEVEAQFLQLAAEGVAAGMLAQHQVGLRRARRLRAS